VIYYNNRYWAVQAGSRLKKIGKRASDTCWWCDHGVKQSREHLFKSCKKWKSQLAILWAEVRKKTKKRKVQVQISELFVEGKFSPAVLDFLRSTGVSSEGRWMRRRSRTGKRVVWGGGLGKCVM